MGALIGSAAGFVLLVVASDRFVAGSAGLALRFRVPAVVVGAVIVGFGTSAPELLASAIAAVDGARDIAVGNIVGSNIANLTLVLGVVAVIAAPTVTSGILRREVPLMALAMLLLAVALTRFSRLAAAGLIVAFVVIMVVFLRSGRPPDDAIAEEVEREIGDEARTRSGTYLAVETALGLVGTVAGAQLLVSGAQSIAEAMDLAAGFIGFTLVALGTSLPELVTGVQAARRNEPDLAIGNVIGSNLFNSLAIGGVTGLISPGVVSPGLTTAGWIATGVGVAVWLLMWTSRRLTRWEGGLLIVAYFATLTVFA